MKHLQHIYQLHNCLFICFSAYDDDIIVWYLSGLRDVNCHVTISAIIRYSCSEAVRSAILATAWLLVHPTYRSGIGPKCNRYILEWIGPIGADVQHASLIFNVHGCNILIFSGIR